MPVVEASRLQTVGRTLFEAAGAPPHIASAVAEILVNANLTGHDSHGVLRIPTYLKAIQLGEIVPAAEPEIVTETAATLAVDGRRGFGHFAARRTMEWAADRAAAGTLCAATLTRNGHIGRLGEYAEQAARRGCIGLITSGRMSTSGGAVAPHGSTRAMLGTNPIACGVPVDGGEPFILDFATSVIAVGKIHDASSRGADLPLQAILDRGGRPSVRPADYYDGGVLLPVGGHKGYALSVLITLLGGLSGAFNPQAGTMGGVFMLALNVGAFLDAGHYGQGVRAVLDALRAVPPAPGAPAVLAPGDPEHRARATRLAGGIEVPESIWSQLREWGGRLGVPIDQAIV